MFKRHVIIVLFFLPFVANAEASKFHKIVEAREYNAENCHRMEGNWDRHAKAWCSNAKGVDWSITERRCFDDSTSVNFVKVEGRITCNQ